MDSTRAIVVCREFPGRVRAYCLSLSGTTVLVGGGLLVEDSSPDFISIARIDSGRALVVYDLAGVGRAAVLTLSGTSLSVGPIVTYDSTASAMYNVVCMMDSTKALVSYAGAPSTYSATAICLTVSGTAISVSSPVVYASAGAQGPMSIYSMDSSHAIVAYSSTRYRCLTLSGTTIAYGSELYTPSGWSQSMSVVGLTSTKAMSVYANGIISGGPRCLFLSGDTLSAGTEIVNPLQVSESLTGVSACLIDSSTAIMIAQDTSSTATQRGRACVLAEGGGTLVGGTPVSFGNTNTSDLACCGMDATHAMVVYSGTSRVGFARCLTLV